MYYEDSLKPGTVCVDLKYPNGIHEHIRNALLIARIYKDSDKISAEFRKIRRVDPIALITPFDY